MTNSNDEWTACSRGEVRDLVVSLREARRHERIQRRSAVGISIVAVLFAAALSLRAFTPAAPLEPIGCMELRQYTQQILANTLSGPLGERIRVHLLHCRSCKDHVDRAREDSAENAGHQIRSVAAL